MDLDFSAITSAEGDEVAFLVTGTPGMPAVSKTNSQLKDVSGTNPEEKLVTVNNNQWPSVN